MRQNNRSDGLYTSTSTGGLLTGTMVASANPTAETQAAEQTGNSSPQGTQPTPATLRKTAVVNVLLVDDHTLMREGLRQLLELEDDIRIVGEAVDGFDALKQVRKLRPEVVLMDIRMPMLDGIAVTRQLTYEFPSIAVIILTMNREHSQVLQAMKNGAKGYLLKSASSQEVAQAIRAVYNGGMLIEPDMTGAIVREFRRLSHASAAGQPVDALTEKDSEILRYVASGMSNKEIADHLSYSEKTVKNYLSAIFQKLGIRDRTQAAIFALRNGILPDDL